MPSRPLFWLTVFFMLGISADRLFGESLPVQTHYFAFAALILIAAMVAGLWFRSSNGGRNTEDGGRRAEEGRRRTEDGGRSHLRSFTIHDSLFTIHYSLFTNFAIPALLFVIFGMWASKAAAPQFPRGLQPFLNGQTASYIAEVSGSPEYYPDKIRIPLHLICAITGDGQTTLDGGLLLTLPRKDPANPTAFLPPPQAAGNPAGGPTAFFLPGDTVLFRAVLKRFRSFRNPGGFDYVNYEAGKGLYAQCFLKDERFLIKIAPESWISHGDPEDAGLISVLRSPSSVLRPLSSVLRSIRGRIDLFRQKTLLWAQRSLDPEPAAFYAAMILGYKLLLDRNWQDHIHQTGLNHLLSVSGLHIGMVSMFVFWLGCLAVRFLFPSILNRISDKHIALWPALACGVLYAFLAGFGAPTIWRSVLTLAVFLLAGFWYRKADSLTVLAFAALVILVMDPGNLWQIPFQLTFVCVLAIIVIYPRFGRFRLYRIFPALGPDRVAGRIVSKFEDAFWVSISINILLIPLIIFYFDGFALTGFFANVFLVPYMGFVVLPLGLLSVLLFAFSQTLAYPVIFIVNYLLWGCLRLIEWFAGFSWSYFWTGSISPVWLFVVYASLGLLFAPFARKVKIAGLGVMAVLICCGLALGSLAGSNTTGPLRVDVIDVGQGASALVRFPTGETMLVDGGGIPDDSYDIGRAVLAPFLWCEGIRRLDHVALSHYHPDHALGLRFILRNFDVGSFWTSGITGDDRKAAIIRCGLDEIALKRRIKIRTFPDLFEDVQIGHARIRLLHPARESLEHLSQKDLNEVSLVLEISFGQTRVILPGDASRIAEDLIIPALEGRMRTLLVAGHHGSRHSSSEEFLDALRPVAIVCSCGYDNPFGFPAPEVIERCAARNIPMYRTDANGAVHAASDGLKWTFTTESDRNINAETLKERIEGF
ncbi:MAG: DNA internalization-related competence protein ComEC/Rec2 [Syntrophobacteraceae bacterium]|jgi:competence protein ComEC